MAGLDAREPGDAVVDAPRDVDAPGPKLLEPEEPSEAAAVVVAFWVAACVVASSLFSPSLGSSKFMPVVAMSRVVVPGSVVVVKRPSSRESSFVVVLPLEPSSFEPPSVPPDALVTAKFCPVMYFIPYTMLSSTMEQQVLSPLVLLNKNELRTGITSRVAI